MSRLFAYGTLRCTEVVRAVLGWQPRGARVLAAGYGVYYLKGECFPGLVQECGSCVEGIVYEGLCRKDWARLDEYECESFYQRRIVQVSDPDPGFSCSPGVQAYVVDPEMASAVLSPIWWDYTDFVQKHLQQYLLELER